MPSIEHINQIHLILNIKISLDQKRNVCATFSSTDATFDIENRKDITLCFLPPKTNSALSNR